jgi:hypothetical protein
MCFYIPEENKVQCNNNFPGNTLYMYFNLLSQKSACEMLECPHRGCEIGDSIHVHVRLNISTLVIK